jgi:succinyl-CoA synthetase beta subunit
MNRCCWRRNLVAEYHSGTTTRDTLVHSSPFVATMKLVAKPDQLVKRRGKLGLLHINKSLDECLKWIAGDHHVVRAHNSDFPDHEQKDVVVEGRTGQFNTFVLEPCVPHREEDEMYVNIQVPIDVRAFALRITHEHNQVVPRRRSDHVLRARWRRCGRR